MADYREHRNWGRGDPRGYDERDYEERGTHSRHDDPPGYGRGSARDRMGSEQFRSQDERGGVGEHDYRDYGRGQPGAPYEHAGSRGYRHGGGYGGFGQAPGESGGGFSSGRSYAAEPGWGPGYGEGSGQDFGGMPGYEGQGSHPGAYGTQHGGGFGGRSGASFGGPGRFGQGRPGHGHYGRGPKGYQRSDERVKEDICERLMSAAYIDAAEVSVDVKDGKVTLEGTVPDRHTKHCIEDVVDSCMGVKDIDNRIRVSRDGGFGAEPTMSIGGGPG